MSPRNKCFSPGKVMRKRSNLKVDDPLESKVSIRDVKAQVSIVEREKQNSDSHNYEPMIKNRFPMSPKQNLKIKHKGIGSPYN